MNSSKKKNEVWVYWCLAQIDPPLAFNVGIFLFIFISLSMKLLHFHVNTSMVEMISYY